MIATPTTGTLLWTHPRHRNTDIETSVSVFSCIWHDTPGEYFECTLKHMTTKYAANNSMAKSMLNIQLFTCCRSLTHLWVVSQPLEYSTTPRTSIHNTNSSIITIVIMVDHLKRSGRAVQYRGHGYSNRFYTLQRLRTLPTLWSTDLVIPFGWTSVAPTKHA